MSVVAIEKDIPIPTISGPGRNPKYPWKELSVGDSFIIPKSIHSASNMAIAASRKYGVKFTCRTVEGGVRVWRIA